MHKTSAREAEIWRGVLVRAMRLTIVSGLN